MNLSTIFPFKIDLGLYWLQRQVFNLKSKCSSIAEQMERPFSSIHFFLKFMDFKAVCWISGAQFITFEWSGLAMLDFFFAHTHKLMQASLEKGLTLSSYKALPNLCLLTRKAFWKGLRNTENLFASLKKKNPSCTSVFQATQTEIIS